MAATDHSLFPVPNSTVSFWRAHPHELDTFRLSDSVPEQCDIAIIGAGLAGVSTAYHILSRPGPRPSVAIFEARQACSGATGRNGGHTKCSPVTLKGLQSQFGTAFAAEFAALQAAQIRAMKAAVDKEGIDCDFFMTRSYDMLFDAEHAADVQAWLEQNRGADWLRDVQWLDGPNLERITGVKGAKGATSTSAASLWPYKFVMGLLARCLELGAALYTQTPVHSTSTSSSGVTLLSTPRGACAARKVVHATNGYAAALLPAYRRAIVPIRGTACALAAHPCPALPYTYNLHHSRASADYLVPRADGHVVLGGGPQTFRHDRAEWYDTVDDAHMMGPQVEEYLAGVMPREFCGYGSAAVERAWTGIMGRTPDMAPHVGKVPETEGQWMLAGFNGGGMSMIFTTAEQLSRMVLDGVAFEETGLPARFETSVGRWDVPDLRP